MISAGLARSWMFCFLLQLLALAMLAGRAIADDRISTRVEVFGFAGLHILTLHSVTEEQGDRSAVAVDDATKGMARMFVDLLTRAQVRGQLVGGSARPLWFLDQTRRNGTDRESRVDYRPDGSVDAVTTPRPEDPVGSAAARGTIDGLTAYFRLERQLAATGRCALTDRVFDGRHGYDLVFSDAGRQKLSVTGGQNFAGEAIACRMQRRIWPGSGDEEKDEGARQGTIWYARLLPGDLMVPVRTQMDTQLGSVEGFLAEIHGRGINLSLME